MPFFQSLSLMWHAGTNRTKQATKRVKRYRARYLEQRGVEQVLWPVPAVPHTCLLPNARRKAYDESGMVNKKQSLIIN